MSRTGAPTLLGPVDAHRLQQGLTLVQMFARKDLLQEDLGTIELRNGRVEGGRLSVIALFNLGCGEALWARIPRVRVIPAMGTLSFFSADETGLYETASHYMFADRQVCIGLPKIHHSFPEAEFCLDSYKAAVHCRMLLDRGELRHCLDRFVANMTDEPSGKTARLHFSGAGNDARLVLQVRDETGRNRGIAKLLGQRLGTEGSSRLADVQITTDLVALARAVGHLETEHVQLVLVRNSNGVPSVLQIPFFDHGVGNEELRGLVTLAGK